MASGVEEHDATKRNRQSDGFCSSPTDALPSKLARVADSDHEDQDACLDPKALFEAIANLASRQPEDGELSELRSPRRCRQIDHHLQRLRAFYSSCKRIPKDLILTHANADVAFLLAQRLSSVFCEHDAPSAEQCRRYANWMAWLESLTFGLGTSTFETLRGRGFVGLCARCVAAPFARLIRDKRAPSPELCLAAKAALRFARPLLGPHRSSALVACATAREFASCRMRNVLFVVVLGKFVWLHGHATPELASQASALANDLASVLSLQARTDQFAVGWFLKALVRHSASFDTHWALCNQITRLLQTLLLAKDVCIPYWKQNAPRALAEKWPGALLSNLRCFVECQSRPAKALVDAHAMFRLLAEASEWLVHQGDGGDDWFGAQSDDLLWLQRNVRDEHEDVDLIAPSVQLLKNILLFRQSREGLLEDRP
jgi:hypothetical protein